MSFSYTRPTTQTTFESSQLKADNKPYPERWDQMFVDEGAEHTGMRTRTNTNAVSVRHSVSGDAVMTADDNVLVMDDVGAVDCELDPIENFQDATYGRSPEVVIACVTGTVTIIADLAEPDTIDGSATLVLTAGQWARLRPGTSGADWKQVG